MLYNTGNMDLIMLYIVVKVALPVFYDIGYVDLITVYVTTTLKVSP